MRIRDVFIKAAVSAWILGGSAEAQDGDGRGIGTGNAAGTTTDATVVDAGSPTTSRPSQLPTAPSRTASSNGWRLPPGPIHIGEETTFRYAGLPPNEILDATKANGKDEFVILLAQTRAKRGEEVTSDNSWFVVQLARMISSRSREVALNFCSMSERDLRTDDRVELRSK